jgi:hypothetical protein
MRAAGDNESVDDDDNGGLSNLIAVDGASVGVDVDRFGCMVNARNFR